MLELIFRGFIEWIYGLILESWEYFSSGLLDIMSLDFSYLESHMPILPTIRQIMLGVGWALLLGNLVFQAVKSMMSGVGIEGEDPRLLFTRSFVFAFLLVASPQICEICLNMTSAVIDLLELPDAVEITLPEDATFVGLSASWLLVVICGIIVMFQSFKLFFEMAERYFILAVLTLLSPLAFGVGGSKNTEDIFTGWCRMYGSMCLLMCMNVVFIKMLLSILSFHPSGLDVLPWMVLVLTVVKVAKKIDSIITRIGLNPAITGDSLGRSFPGALTYMVARSAVSQVVKTAGKTIAQGAKPTGENKAAAGKSYFREKASAAQSGAAGKDTAAAGRTNAGQYAHTPNNTPYGTVPKTKNTFVGGKAAEVQQTANPVPQETQKGNAGHPYAPIPGVKPAAEHEQKTDTTHKSSVLPGMHQGTGYVNSVQNGTAGNVQNARSTLYSEARGGRNYATVQQSSTVQTQQSVTAPQESRPIAPTATRFSRNTPNTVTATPNIAPAKTIAPAAAGVSSVAASPSPARQESAARSGMIKVPESRSSPQHDTAGTAAAKAQVPVNTAHTLPNGAGLVPKAAPVTERAAKPGKSSKRKGKKHGRKAK